MADKNLSNVFLTATLILVGMLLSSPNNNSTLSLFMEQSVFWSTTFPISSVIIFLSRARSGHSRRKCSVSCGPWPQSHCVVTSCSALRLSDWLRWWALSRVCPTISLFNRTSAARSTQPVVFWRVLCRLSLTQGIRLWVNLPSV